MWVASPCRVHTFLSIYWCLSCIHNVPWLYYIDIVAHSGGRYILVFSPNTATAIITTTSRTSNVTNTKESSSISSTWGYVRQQPLHLRRWNNVQFTRGSAWKSLHCVIPCREFPGLHKGTADTIWWTRDRCVGTWGVSVFGEARNLEWFFNIMEHAHFSRFQKPEYSSFAHSHPLHSYIGSCLQQYLSVHSRKALFWQRRPPLGHISHCESSWLRNGLCFLLLSTSITHLLIC